MLHIMILSRNDFFKHLESHFQWSPFIKVTNLCNNTCAHCCERSGPNCPAVFINQSDVKEILSQFKTVKNFLNVVTITGGEPMISYSAHSDYYIPQILTHCAKQGYETYLNTNARWTLGENSEKIFSDLSNHLSRFNKNKLYFRLSQDSFHTNSTQSNTEFINWFINNQNTCFPVSGLYMFYDTNQNKEKLFITLAEKYHIRFIPICESATNQIYKHDHSNHLFCTMPYQGIQDMGRAKDNHISTRRMFTKHELFFAPYIDPEQEICFDASGYALLSACGDDTIKTEYRNADGKLKPINKIKNELFNKAYDAYLFESQLFRR